MGTVMGNYGIDQLGMDYGDNQMDRMLERKYKQQQRAKQTRQKAYTRRVNTKFKDLYEALKCGGTPKDLISKFREFRCARAEADKQAARELVEHTALSTPGKTSSTSSCSSASSSSLS